MARSAALTCLLFPLSEIGLGERDALVRGVQGKPVLEVEGDARLENGDGFGQPALEDGDVGQPRRRQRGPVRAQGFELAVGFRRLDGLVLGHLDQPQGHEGPFVVRLDLQRGEGFLLGRVEVSHDQGIPAHVAMGMNALGIVLDVEPAFFGGLGHVAGVIVGDGQHGVNDVIPRVLLQ